MADERIGIDLEATDDASKVIDHVADKVDDLAATPAVVDVEADTGAATGDLAQLSDQIDRLDASTATVDVDATPATSAMHSIGSSAEQGVAAATDALSNLGGPVGDAAGQIGGMASGLAALGPAGIIAGGALGAVITLWNRAKDAAARNKEQVDKYRKAIEDAGGALEDAARVKLSETLTDKQVRTLDRYALTLSDVTAAMRGETIPALNDLSAAADEYAAAQNRIAQGGSAGVDNARLASLHDQADAYRELSGLIDREGGNLDKANDLYAARARVIGDNVTAADKLKAAMDRVNGTLDVEAEALNLEDALTAALDTSGQSANDATRDVIDLKREIVNAAELAKASPVELAATIDKVDHGDLAGATADAQAWLNRNPVTVTLIPNMAQNLLNAIAARTAAAAGGRPAAAAASTTNVTVVMPRGARWDAAANRAARRYTRRNGGRVLRR